MGLSPYPTPADGGVLCIIVVGTAISFSMLKDLFLSILHMAGIRIASMQEHPIDAHGDFYDLCQCPSENYMDEFRSHTPTVRFKSLSQIHHLERECSVCLTVFEPDNMINHLSCGHIFHKVCLEKWVKYWNVTCPLCRTRMPPFEEEEDFLL